MLQEVKDLQNKAINELLNLVKNSIKKEFIFKAPTGSGKTFMMAKFCNEILKENNKVMFLISSLSKGNLAEQNYNKFLEYSKEFKNLDCYLINSDFSGEERAFIEEDHNVYFLPRDLYKEKSILKEQGVFEEFLKIKKKENNIIYIKDECHIATNKLDSLSNFFYKVVNFSATPKLNKNQEIDVEITEEDAIKHKLIKDVEFIESSFELENQLNDVLIKYKEIKEKYNNLLNINPCLIIQISNKEEGEEEWNKIKKILDDNNLKWLYIVDDKSKCDKR